MNVKMNDPTLNDPTFEALFRQAIIDDYIAEVDSIPTNEELAKTHPLSPAFERKMQRLLTHDRRKEAFMAAGKLAWRVAVVLIVAAIVLFGALLSNSEVRAAVQNVIVQWYDQFTAFEFKGDATNDDIGHWYPAYLPDGYVEDMTIDLGNMVRIVFMDDSGDDIRFTYSPENAGISIFVDNENHLIEEFFLDGHTAFMATALDENFDNGVIINTDDYVIDIWGKISIDELIMIAESIVEVE